MTRPDCPKYGFGEANYTGFLLDAACGATLPAPAAGSLNSDDYATVQFDLDPAGQYVVAARG